MIPSDLYDSYIAALSENDRHARAALAEIMARLDPADIHAVRDEMAKAYPALVKLYGTRAAQVAVEFYVSVRAAQRVESRFAAEFPAESEIYDEGECAADVRREVGGLFSGRSTFAAFTSTMQGLATKRTMQMADNAIYSLAAADPAHPKAALVPHPGACGWCVMLGSRGFANTEKAMENMRHDACRCATVVDFDTKNPALEGYDEMALYEEYARADTPENQRKWLEEWESMGDDERSRYVRRVKDPKTGKVKEYVGDWSTYRRNRTVQEMNRNLARSSADNPARFATARAVASEMGFGGSYSAVHVHSAYAKCNAAIGQAGEWGELGAVQRAAVLAEMCERDVEWVRRGAVPEPTYQSERALRDLEPHEKVTRDTIAANGLYQHVLQRSKVQGVKTADCTLGTSQIKTDWKSPKGAGFNAIDQLMRDAGKKADVAIVDLQEGRSVMSLEDAIKHWRACGARRGIREVYFIDYDRTMHHRKL